jgi:hypothetical protein
MLVWTGNLDQRGPLLLGYDPATDSWAPVGGPFVGAEGYGSQLLVIDQEVFVLGPQLRVPFVN